MMKKHKVSDYYDAVADSYHTQYDQDSILQAKEYPANYFRLQLLINSFLKRKIKKVLEVGVGEGTPLIKLAQIGMDVFGFDISKKMVKKAKDNFSKNDLNPDRIFWGDIQDPVTYSSCLKDGFFDGLIAMGVMPHVKNDEIVLKNMANCVKKGGVLFIEFRNKLFSLFTFNRYTLDFILDDLLADVDPVLKDAIRKDLEPRLRIDMPPVRNKVENQDAPGYDAILSKFHNPFEIKKLFEEIGFKEINFLWYHYHPAMPYLESVVGNSYRKEAIKLEHETSEWKGLFLCSAFIVEAVR